MERGQPRPVTGRRNMSVPALRRQPATAGWRKETIWENEGHDHREAMNMGE